MISLHFTNSDSKHNHVREDCHDSTMGFNGGQVQLTFSRVSLKELIHINRNDAVPYG